MNSELSFNERIVSYNVFHRKILEIILHLMLGKWLAKNAFSLDKLWILDNLMDTVL